MRIGLMGAGSVADFGHAPAIRAVEGLELAAIYDPTPGKAATFAHNHGSPLGTDDLSAFFAANLDAVTIASPAGAHLQNVVDCAEHCLPVLCEKPIAMDDAEAVKIVTHMASADLPLMIGFVYRFSPVAAQIRDWILDGKIGEVRSLRLIYDWGLHGRYAPNAAGVWGENPVWHGRMQEGGPMVDCGVHFIDLARWWLDSEVVRQSVAAAWVADYEAPDHVYAHLDHANGVHTMVEMSFSYGHTVREPAPQFSYDIIGTGGTIRYDRSTWRLELRDGDGVVVGPSASEKGFHEMYRAWGNALRTRDFSEIPTGEDGLRATHIARSLTNEAIARR